MPASSRGARILQVPEGKESERAEIDCRLRKEERGRGGWRRGKLGFIKGLLSQWMAPSYLLVS